LRPSSMPLTRLANIAVDRDPIQREAIVKATAGYAGTDLVCYRAADQQALAARQEAVWQPLVDWARHRYDAPPAVTAGGIPTLQPAASPAALAAPRGGDGACRGDRSLRLAGHRLGTFRGPPRPGRSLRRFTARRELSNRSLGRGRRAGRAPPRARRRDRGGGPVLVAAARLSGRAGPDPA